MQRIKSSPWEQGHAVGTQTMKPRFFPQVINEALQ
jgi:hypothetical protein